MQFDTNVKRATVADRPSSSLWVLVAANLIPVTGVALWGWKIGDVVFLYWAENLVIGMFNFVRMLMARGKEGDEGTEWIELVFGKLFTAAFFLLHYGGFCYGHGVFLVLLFPPTGSLSEEDEPFTVLWSLLHQPAVLAAFAAIAVSHAYSFFHNYVGRGEYRSAKVDELMGRPYKRILVTHFFILTGGLLLIALGSPLAAILLFVALKIALDGWSHHREHAPPADPGHAR